MSAEVISGSRFACQKNVQIFVMLCLFSLLKKEANEWRERAEEKGRKGKKREEKKGERDI